MADEKQRSSETHRGDTHAAPMVDDTNMSTYDADETAAADETADAAGENAETGIMHAPLSGAGQAGTGSGSYAVLGGANIAGGAGLYPVDLDPTSGAPSPVGNDLNPEQRGLKSGPDQDVVDANDRNVADRADSERD